LPYGIIYPEIMKKSEKIKGKAMVAVQRKAMRKYWIAAVVGIIMVAVIGFFLLTSAPVAKMNDTVVIYYTGMLDNGTIFDSNLNRTPLEFTIGEGRVIPGFEEAVIGMAVNSDKTVHIPVAKAYGPYLPELVVTVNRSSFPTEQEPVVGSFWTVTSPSGELGMVRIVNVTAKSITVDENHELAGQNLTFMLKLAKIVQK
jgi:peptidylprolyl isomerase